MTSPTIPRSITPRRLEGKAKPGQHAIQGASQFFADFGYLPLLHTLVEERAGERRLLFRWEVHGEEALFRFPPPFPLMHDAVGRDSVEP
jgi:hypothetical protein